MWEPQIHTPLLSLNTWATGSFPVRLNISTLQLGSKGGIQSIHALLCSSGVIRNGSQEGAFYYCEYFPTTANTEQPGAVIWTVNGNNWGNWLCSTVHKFHFFLIKSSSCIIRIYIHIYIYIYIFISGHAVATSRKVAGLIPNEVIGSFDWSNPSSRTMALGSTQPLTEMGTRNLRRGKRPARKADNITAICEPIVLKMWELDDSQLYGPAWHVTGIALPLLYIYISLSKVLSREVSI
jgi:hypothetical protein